MTPRSAGGRSQPPGEPALRRAYCRSAWLVLAGLVTLIGSGRFAPLIAYGLILVACVLIGHGGNVFMRTLLADGARIRRLSRRSRPLH